MARVLVAIPTGGEVRAVTVNWLLGFDRCGHDVNIMVSELRPIEANRNHIRKAFLDGDYDYLIQMDSDILPPANLLEIVDLDKDIVSAGIRTVKGDQVLPLALKEVSAGEYLPMNYQGLFRCDAVGGGCVCIRRNVLEQLDYQHMSETVKAEDFDFCERARGAGFEVWYHEGMRAVHFTIAGV